MGVIYKGKRNAEGFMDFARRMLNPAVSSVQTVDEMTALLKFNDVVYVMGFSETDASHKAIFDGYSAVAKDKRVSFTMAASSSPAVLDSFKAQATPFIAKVQSLEPPQFFSLPPIQELEGAL